MNNERNIDVKTKIDYYSRLSVCGENDSDTETFYFLWKQCSFFWLHLKPYKDDYVINTDNKSVQQIVDEIKAIVDSEVNE